MQSINYKSPLGYRMNDDEDEKRKKIDSYGVDHSNFTTRDEVAYQTARTEREEQLKAQYQQQGVTDYPQHGKDFWGNNPQNNHGFGTTNISANIDAKIQEPIPTFQKESQQTAPQRTVYQDLTGFRSNNTKWYENNPQKDNINLVNSPERYTNANKTFNDCVDSERYNRFVENAIKREGNNVHTSDQLTNRGISNDFYNNLMKQSRILYPNYPQSVNDLTPEQVKNLYCQEVYKPSRAEAFNSEPLAEQTFDMFVNMGSGQGSQILQRAINDKMGAGIDTSGGIGTQTVTAANNIEQNMLPAVNNQMVNLRNQFYRELAEKNPEMFEFLKGLLKRSNSFKIPQYY